MKLSHAYFLLMAGLIATAVLLRADEPSTPTPKPADKTAPTSAPAMKPSTKVIKSDDEWRKKLTPEQYQVTRHAATERPFGAAYEEFNKEGEGTYYCVCCGAELFTSSEKFHSGCGWPSFYDQSKAKNVAEHVDVSLGMRRVEVVCTRCDAHLGHVFEHEGFGTPTDRRFCINAASLHFVPKGGEAPKLEVVDSEKVKATKEAVKKAGGE